MQLILTVPVPMDLIVRNLGDIEAGSETVTEVELVHEDDVFFSSSRISLLINRYERQNTRF